LRLAKRLIALVIVVVLVIGIAGVGLLAWITNRALPQTSGDLQVPGLSAPVTVVRDASGIAHITADTPHDLFMGQGYVHAQERMWQMEVWRHISAGRLSELFGESQLDTDRFIRTVGWWEAAERDLASFSPATVAILDAYTAGVNAWLDRNHGSLGLAYLVTGTTPEPWTNLDTVAWAKVQAWDLGNDLGSEIFRYLADARLGDPARTDSLFPGYPEDAPIVTPSGLEGSGGAGADRPAVPPTAARPVDPITASASPPTAAQAAAWRTVAAIGRTVLSTDGAGAARTGGIVGSRGIGSNNWVVGRAMSASGGALLANDPHLDVSMPSIWIVNGLHCRTVSDACPYDVAGVSFPGAPGVVLGHNARVAWGATNIYADVQDLVIEAVDPTDPGRYLTADGSRPFTIRHEEVGLSGADPVSLDVRETIHGPILNEVDEDLADAPPMALRWTALQAEDHTLEAVLALATVADFDDFRTALSRYGAPAQNFVYADVDGHIGYQYPGFMPVRADPSDTGLRPVSGADGRHEWVGRIPFDDLPWQLDPEPGWIVSANNAPVDANYPYRLGSEWDPGDRAQRIIDLLDGYGQDGLTIAELGQIQMDGAPLRARDVGFTVSDLTDPSTGGVPPTTEDGALIRDRIDTWDGGCTEDSVGCAAYMSWEYRLQRAIFDDELGPLARDYVGSGESWLVVADLLDDPNAAWWDDTTTTDVVETGPLIVARAMDEAGAELRAAIGGPEAWTWGRLHSVAFNEQTLGESGIWPLEWFFDKGPFPVAGADGAPDATSWDVAGAYADPQDPTYQPVGIDGVFEVTSLPSYRLAIDLSDLDAARIIITTGQSGNPGDKHYGDMIEAWRTGGTVPLPFTPDAISTAAASTLTLTP
jgi:penicillin amidase